MKRFLRPAILSEPDLLAEPLVLRPLDLSHARTLRRVRNANEAWLQRWAPSNPEAQSRRSPGLAVCSLARRSPVWPYVSMLRQRVEVVRGRSATWAVCYGGEFAGQVSVWNINWGSARTALISYWVDERYAGRSITPTAIAMMADHCFQVLRLHRLEAGIEPENSASRRVVEKLGFREEGTRRREVHINGAWRDLTYYAITVEDVPAGLLSRWRESLAGSRHPGLGLGITNVTLREGCVRVLPGARPWCRLN